MPEEYSPKINRHVSRLNRYLPFSASHDQIYDEYQKGEDSLSLDTVALEYAKRAIEAGAQCIVLTGDAGHGKTHLCRRLIKDILHLNDEDAGNILVTKCDGTSTLENPASGSTKKLRIHKDFSELDLRTAADLIEQSANISDETLVICANEGRLRAIINSEYAKEQSREIGTLFKQSFKTGRSSTSTKIHIINLNFQSIASNFGSGSNSLLRRTFLSWANDKRRWHACSGCSLNAACPIKHNQLLLVEEGELSGQRVSRLEKLAAVVERLGHVITIREMLMLVAYLVTGGMTCPDILKKWSEKNGVNGWQHDWAFYNLLFQAPPGTSDDRIYKGIPVLALIRRLDPGLIASRRTDEKLLNTGDIFKKNQLDLLFNTSNTGKEKIVDAALGIDDFLGNPQNKSEQANENKITAVAVRSLRRRSYFDDELDSRLMTRLGFNHGDSFQGLLNESLGVPEFVKLKNTIVNGLHAIQGLRMSQVETTLHLVDPAFGKASSDAAIIARRIPTSQIQMLPARKAWSSEHLAEPSDWNVYNSVDWIDRSVIVRVKNKQNTFTDIALDLLSFECVARSASGYIPEDFYSHEIRRIRTFLGKLASEGEVDGEISLFMKGRVQNVSIDMNVIQVAGN